jgi:hypothetical protein
MPYVRHVHPARRSGRWSYLSPLEVLMHARFLVVVSQLVELCFFFAAAAVLAVGLMSMR